MEKGEIHTYASRYKIRLQGNLNALAISPIKKRICHHLWEYGVCRKFSFERCSYVYGNTFNKQWAAAAR
jgi:hypothetical protein